MNINEKIEALRQEARAEYEAAMKRADAARAAMRTLGIEVDAAPVIEATPIASAGAPDDSQGGDQSDAETLPLFQSEADSTITDTYQRNHASYKKTPNVAVRVVAYLIRHGVTPEVKLAKVVYKQDDRAIYLLRKRVSILVSNGLIDREPAVVPGLSEIVYRVTSKGKQWWNDFQSGHTFVPIRSKQLMTR